MGIRGILGPRERLQNTGEDLAVILNTMEEPCNSGGRWDGLYGLYRNDF